MWDQTTRHTGGQRHASRVGLFNLRPTKRGGTGSEGNAKPWLKAKASPFRLTGTAKLLKRPAAAEPAGGVQTRRTWPNTRKPRSGSIPLQGLQNRDSFRCRLFFSAQTAEWRYSGITVWMKRTGTPVAKDTLPAESQGAYRYGRHERRPSGDREPRFF
jgi:hypothetical protein